MGKDKKKHKRSKKDYELPVFEDERVDLSDDDDSPTTELARVTETRNPALYLADDVTSVQVIIALVPPDLHRCQCEWLDATLPTFGPKPVVRCDQVPTVVAFQKREVDEPAPTGAISLCDDHRLMIDHMYPGQCYFRRITTDKKIGDFV